MSYRKRTRSSWTWVARLMLGGLLSNTFGVNATITHKGSACTFDQTMQATSFCVNATVDSGSVTYELTSMVHAPEDVGWLALGFGQNMIRTQLVILWQNDDGSMTVSQRYARYYAEPSVLADPPRVGNAVELKDLVDSWQKPNEHTTYAFRIPAKERLLNGTSLHENLIWAYSPIRPHKNYTSHIARHFEIGHMKLKFGKVEPAPSRPEPPSSSGKPENDGDNKNGTATKPNPGKGHTHEDDEDGDDHYHSGHEKAVHAHAYLLSFGFLFILPMGILAGRWGRTISPVWFKVHWILNMAVAAPIIALGWLLGPVAVWQHGGGHLNDAHKICGFILVALYGGQVLLGRFIHSRRVEKMESGVKITNYHPPLNIAHVAFGLVFIMFAFFQVRSGLDKLQAEPEEKLFAKWYHKVWAIWGLVLPLLYLAGLTLLPRQFRQERAGGLDTSGGHSRLPSNGDETYVPLTVHPNRRETEEASSSTRLLFESRSQFEVGDDDEDDQEEDDMGLKGEKRDSRQ